VDWLDSAMELILDTRIPSPMGFCSGFGLLSDTELALDDAALLLIFLVMVKAVGLTPDTVTGLMPSLVEGTRTIIGLTTLPSF